MRALACLGGPLGRASVDAPTPVRALRRHPLTARAAAARVPPEPTTIAEIWSEMRVIADSLGVPERGVQLVTRVRARLRAIADRAATLPPARIAVIGALTPPRPAARWLAEVLALAHVTDVLAEADPARGTITSALLKSIEPDAIFIAPWGLDLAAARAAVFARGPRVPWRATRAAAERRVIVADGIACFHRAGPRVAETLETVVEVLHPQAFRFGHAGRTWSPLAR